MGGLPPGGKLCRNELLDAPCDEHQLPLAGNRFKYIHSGISLSIKRTTWNGRSFNGLIQPFLRQVLPQQELQPGPPPLLQPELQPESPQPSFPQPEPVPSCRA